MSFPSSILSLFFSLLTLLLRLSFTPLSFHASSLSTLFVSSFYLPIPSLPLFSPFFSSILLPPLVPLHSFSYSFSFSSSSFSSSFSFVNVPFDLSQVLFIATANSLSHVPAALKDRMEVLHLPAYTLYEKVCVRAYVF